MDSKAIPRNAARLLAIITLTSVYAFSSFGQDSTRGSSVQRTDDGHESKPLATVTMVPPDHLFQVELNEKSLSGVGRKYVFLSNAKVVKDLISTIEDQTISVGDKELIRRANGGYNFDVRYKVEFGGEFLSHGDYLFGPNGQDFLVGIVSSRPAQSQPRYVVLRRTVQPALFALLQKADNFGEPELRRYDESVIEYSNPNNWGGGIWGGRRSP